MIAESNKDLAPRFKKNNLIVSKDEMEEVELRPNSMLITKASLKTNNLMNNRTMESTFATQHTVKSQPTTTLLKDPLPIKQVPAEKPKQSKKDKVFMNLV